MNGSVLSHVMISLLLNCSNQSCRISTKFPFHMIFLVWIIMKDICNGKRENWLDFADAEK